MKARRLGLETDEAGTGTWKLLARTVDGNQLEIVFQFSDGTATQTTMFRTKDAVPGPVTTEAGTFEFAGSDRGGNVTFAPSALYVEELRALGQQAFGREVLASAMLRMPLAYAQNALRHWPRTKMSNVVGLYLFGATGDDIDAALAANPNASPTDVMVLGMKKNLERGG